MPLLVRAPALPVLSSSTGWGLVFYVIGSAQLNTKPGAYYQYPESDNLRCYLK